MLSRRSFVLDCATAVASVALVPAVGLGNAVRGPGPGSEGLDFAAFAAQINTVFQVQLPSGQVVDLRLLKARLSPRAQVVAGRRPAPDAQNEKFSLVFGGPVHFPLPAAIHTFRHPKLGQFELYFGEIGARQDDCIRYEAVFNRASAMPMQGPERGRISI